MPQPPRPPRPLHSEEPRQAEPFPGGSWEGGKGKRPRAAAAAGLCTRGPRPCPGPAAPPRPGRPAPRPPPRRQRGTAAGPGPRARTARTSAGKQGVITGTSYLLPLYIAKGRGATSLGVPEEVSLQRNETQRSPALWLSGALEGAPRPARGSPGWKNIDIAMRGVCPGPSSSSRFPGGELQSSVPAAELHTQGAAAARCCNRRVSLAMWLHFVPLPPRPPHLRPLLWAVAAPEPAAARRGASEERARAGEFARGRARSCCRGSCGGGAGRTREEAPPPARACARVSEECLCPCAGARACVRARVLPLPSHMCY